jgi:hypothetical protein
MTLVATGLRVVRTIPRWGRNAACYGHRIKGSWGPWPRAPMTARTHPEKKWVAGTNESKARANHLVDKSRLTEWVHGRHAGDASQRGEKGQCIGLELKIDSAVIHPRTWQFPTHFSRVTPSPLYCIV